MVEQQTHQDQITLQARSKVFWPLLSFTSSKKTSVQNWVFKKIENSWRFPGIIAEAEYNQKEGDKWDNLLIRVWKK